MLRAFCDFSWRIIGQPIVPRVKPGLAAPDGIILIAPRVIVVCEFVQRCSCRAHTLIFERVVTDGRRRLCYQILVRNVRVTL